FERTRAMRLNLHAAALVKQAAQRKHIQAFIDRFRYKASKARQAQSRIKMLERMGEVAPLAPPEEITFEFPDPDQLAPPIVAIENASIGYAPGKSVLTKLGLRIDMDDRIALLGPNGNGKSTLLKLLARRLEPQAGSVRRSGKLRVGYFDQDQTQSFDLDRTAYDHLAAAMPDLPEVKVRAHLGRFGFGQDRANRKVGQLSGGERARLLFALVTRDAPHLLLLDEPTNHLDIEARDALVAALGAFEGAVILVSHDPRMVAATADRLWLVADGTCKPFDGDLDDYRRHLIDERRAAQRGGNGKKPPAGDKKAPVREQATVKREVSKADERRASAEARQKLKPLRQAVAHAEKQVDRLTKEKQGLEARLADPALYNGAPAEVTKIQRDLAHAIHELNAAEDAWLTAHEAYEDAAKTAG
ncbi:MAG: ABC-F family ATP-binding cassette domain-containing protein, partial [Alphaproteobacteria bacterium]|nr:ABC-F family ATP-binding cassette domain-containing protein [Alphaproteobacteria bacterium]